jgi:hypothetical protein
VWTTCAGYSLTHRWRALHFFSGRNRTHPIVGPRQQEACPLVGRMHAQQPDPVF